MTAEEMIEFFAGTPMPKEDTPEYTLYEKHLVNWRGSENVKEYAFMDYVAEKARKKLQDE